MIGSRATPRCISNSGVADRIEWRSIEGDVLASGTSLSYLELVLDPVNDSLSVHGSEFTCFITRDEGMVDETVFNQTLSVTVRGTHLVQMLATILISICNSSLSESHFSGYQSIRKYSGRVRVHLDMYSIRDYCWLH